MRGLPPYQSPIFFLLFYSFRHPSSRSFPGPGLAVSYGSVYLYLHLDLRLKDMKLAMVQPRLLAIERILKLPGKLPLLLTLEQAINLASRLECYNLSCGWCLSPCPCDWLICRSRLLKEGQFIILKDVNPRGGWVNQ